MQRALIQNACKKGIIQMKIYVLSHGYDYGYDYDKEEARFIGVYSTRKKALKALKEYKKIRGFSSHLDGFYIGSYIVDKTLGWIEGYKTGFFDPEIGFYESKNEVE